MYANYGLLYAIYEPTNAIMKIVNLLLIPIIFASASNISNAIVHVDIISVSADTYFEADWIVDGGNGDDGGGIWIDDNNAGFLSAETGTVAAGYEWDVSEYGVTLDPAHFLSNSPFADNKAGGGFVSNFMPVSNGQVFTWGFWYDFDYNEIVSSGDYVGWAQLRYFNGNLTVLQSYADDTGHGMIVGETTAIPEPSTILMIGLVCLISMLTKKRLEYLCIGSH